MRTTVRRWLRAFFCPSAWVTTDPTPDLRQERIALAHQPQRGAAPSGTHEPRANAGAVEDEDGGCRTRAAAPTAPRWINPAGEIPPGWTMAALRQRREMEEYANRVIAESVAAALAGIVTEPELVAEMERMRSRRTTADGIPYEVETVTSAEDFEAIVRSALEVTREKRKGEGA